MNIISLIVHYLIQFVYDIYNFINKILGVPWISIVPSEYLIYVAPVSLVISGYLTNRHYIGRIQIFTNTIALNMLFYYSETNLAYFGTLFLSLFEWYANIGLIMGIIAVISYTSKIGRSKIYYKSAWAYNSILVGLIMIVFYAYPYF